MVKSTCILFQDYFDWITLPCFIIFLICFIALLLCINLKSGFCRVILHQDNLLYKCFTSDVGKKL